MINYTIPEKEDKTRYFLFNYFTGEDIGSIWVQNTEGRFPNNDFIKDTIKVEYGFADVVVIGFFEFNSKEDYLDFTN